MAPSSKKSVKRKATTTSSSTSTCNNSKRIKQETASLHPCRICCDDKPEEDFPPYVALQAFHNYKLADSQLQVPFRCQGHLCFGQENGNVCNDCIASFLMAGLDGEGRGAERLGCIQQGCNQPWEYVFIHRFLHGTPAFETYHDQMLRAFLHQHPLAQCPYTSCQSSGSVDYLAAGYPSVECYGCKEKFCAQCQVPWHKNESCQAYTNRTGVGDEERKTLATLSKSGYKRCPRCQIAIQKTVGCNDMYCVMCHTHFDYGKGEKVTFLAKRDVPRRRAAEVATEKIHEQYNQTGVGNSSGAIAGRGVCEAEVKDAQKKIIKT